MKRTGWQFPKSLAKANLTCGYVYQDGIVLVEEKTARVGKYETTVRIAHCYRVNIPMRVYPSHGVACIVVYRPDTLRDGLADVEIYLHNVSESMRKREIDAIGVHYTTFNGGRHGENQYDFVSSAWGVQFEDIANPIDTYSQPHGPASIDDWQTPRGEFRVEWH